MSRPLDELYFDWLYDQVGSGSDARPCQSYLKTLEQLFFKEFVWIVANDDNRAEDGKDLRREFLEERNIRNPDPNWMWIGCSVLELLIGISRRLAFEADGEAKDWFWILIENLGLHKYSDNKRMSKEAINDILDRLIWRTYENNGRGGLFPLKFPKEDQRGVEIWYQLSAYLLEQPQ